MFGIDSVTAVILGLGLLFVLRGAWRGLSGELAPLVGLVSCAGTLWFGYPPLHQALAMRFPTLDADACVYYAALLTLLAGAVAFFCVAGILRRFVKVLFPQPFDALLGAAVGVAKAILLISVCAGVLSVGQGLLERLRTRAEASPLAGVAATLWHAHFTSQRPTEEVQDGGI